MGTGSQERKSAALSAALVQRTDQAMALIRRDLSTQSTRPFRRPRRSRGRAALGAAICLSIAAGTAAPALAAGPARVAGPQRGTLVSSVELEGLNTAQATAYVKKS